MHALHAPFAFCDSGHLLEHFSGVVAALETDHCNVAVKKQGELRHFKYVNMLVSSVNGTTESFRLDNAVSCTNVLGLHGMSNYDIRMCMRRNFNLPESLCFYIKNVPESRRI